MFVKLRKIKVPIILTSLFVIVILSGFTLLNQKHTFDVKKEQLTEDLLSYSIHNESYSGKIYEVDILCNNEVSEDIIKEYSDNAVIPEGTVAIHLKFYNKYSDNEDKQNKSNLIYEYKKFLF